ncbi:hypothetical protein ABI_42490 [Asticcacaulis biprosthecium C19]|uniref:Lipoprotein n=1 Tax=Asticcacaulis biprosthecium C19 TaxID=715226 RepID=F4QSV6_9CAUL|nr:hypothetical protein [Asticcacaulis biprosthecium]EGF89826.1 hypothetical protein ABI_42490 [Asticcacaulis biprosthecium C19]
MKKYLVAAVLLGLFTAPAFAQDAAAPSESEVSAEEVLTVSIGCIATYDTVVAQGKAGARAADIQKARGFAVEIYKEFSGESDEEVAADIQKAGELFPDMLKDSGTTLEDFQQTCDAIFLEEEDSAPTA